MALQPVREHRAEQRRAEAEGGLLDGGEHGAAGAGLGGRHLREADAEEAADDERLAEADHQGRRRQVEDARLRPDPLQGQHQAEQAAHLDDAAEQQQAYRADPRRHPGGEQRRDEVGGAEGDEGIAGLYRRETGAGLQGQGEGEHEAAPAGEEQDRQQQAEADARQAQQRRRQQRPGLAAFLAQLGAPQPGQQRHRRRQQQGAGPGPVQRWAESQRQQQAEDQRGEQQGARRVDAGGMLGAGLRYPAAAAKENAEADRQVDQEHAAPAEAADVGGDQEAAEHLADDEGQAADGAVGGQRAGMRVAAEADMQGGEDLRHDQRRADALQGARHQQQPDRTGQPAKQRGDGEQGDAEIEQAATAVVVAKPAAHRQAHGEGHAVDGDDQFQFGFAGAEGMGEGVEGDVDDGEIDHRQQLPRQQDAEPGEAEPRRRDGAGHGRSPCAEGSGLAACTSG